MLNKSAKQHTKKCLFGFYNQLVVKHKNLSPQNITKDFSGK